jgi:sialate O-acetylesterase
MRTNLTGPGLAALLTLCAWSAPAHALVALSTVDSGRVFDLFGDHMVLQRDTNTPVFGTASAGEQVTVTIGAQSKTTTGDSQGKWRVLLDPMPAGGPYDLTVSGPLNTVTITDVMLGDVFLMAGQSNLMIRRLRPAAMAEYPEVRVFKRTWRDRPGGTPFAVGRRLHRELGVPVGILQRGMRGSSGLIRTWLGPDAVNSPDLFIREITYSDDWGQSYHAVIGNVAGFAIKGVIWWQGEADMRRHKDPGLEYGLLLREVIRSWRVAWDQGLFPFLFLQQPVGGGYQPEQEVVDPLPEAPMAASPAGLMRQAYMETLSVENTQVITSGDLLDGLHPRDREAYALRIVNGVLARVYDYDITYAGPTYASSTIEAGGRVRIRFREGTARGLHAKGGDLQGFEIAGAGGEKVFANSVIEGEEVVVWSDGVPSPVLVRYGYAKDYTFANLHNDGDMAAPTFTTRARPFPE